MKMNNLFVGLLFLTSGIVYFFYSIKTKETKSFFSEAQNIKAFSVSIFLIFTGLYLIYEQI